MNKQGGFTLIELLAVIVILAIIAVIAVPIVLNIIDESKDNATLRSAEFYLDAVEYAISDAYLNHGGLQDGEYPITQEGNLCKTALPCSDANTLKVQVNGEVPESGTITITNGNISSIDLKYEEKTIVKNTEGELVYQETSSTQVYKPQYYMGVYAYGKIGENLPSEAKEKISDVDNITESNPTGYSIYVGYDVDSNNKVTTIYACFIRNKIEYCLKVYDPEAYDTNISILEDAFKDVEDACKTESYGYVCTYNNVSVSIDDSDISLSELANCPNQYGVGGFIGFHSEGIQGGEGV